MKITITSPMATLDRRITSFASLPIDESDYTTYKEQSEDGEYLITNRWILRLEKKVLKQDTVYLVLPICTYVKIKYCQQDIITNGRTYCVELFNGGNYSEVILESDVLTAQGVKLLLAHGCL